MTTPATQQPPSAPGNVGTPTPLAPVPRLVSLRLPVGRMTCASCAARIERRLNRLDGVEASVNFATETAAVSYDAARVSPEQLVARVEATGYTTRLPEPQIPDSAAAPTAHDAPSRGEEEDALPAGRSAPSNGSRWTARRIASARTCSALPVARRASRARCPLAGTDARRSSGARARSPWPAER
jgi:copper chaperone CopZ